MKERLAQVLDRIDRWQRGHTVPAVGFAVVRKFSQDKAGNLAALISYYAFFSIFPLLLAATTTLFYVTAGNTGLYRTVFCGAVGSLPIINTISQPTKGATIVHCSSGQTIGVHSLTGSPLALIVGLVLALYSGLAVAKTAQTAFNDVYAVAQTDRPNFLKGILRAIVLVVIVGVGLVAATVVGSAASSAGTLGLTFVGPGLRVVSVLLSIAVLAVVFDLAFNWLTVREMTWRQALPGAVFAAVGYEVIAQFATAFIAHKASSSNATYGTFATVIAMLSWFYLTAQVVLLAAELNVVLQFRLWPRALHGEPDTDADYRSLEALAERERYHDQEDVDTSFEGRDATKQEAASGR